MALAGSVLLGSSGLAACGRASGAVGSAPAAQRAGAIDWFFPATVAQSDGGQRLLHTLHVLSVRAVSACLQSLKLAPAENAYASGLENYAISPYQTRPGFVKQWTSALTDVRQVARTRMLVQVVTGASKPPSAAGLPAADVHALAGDLARCVNRVRPPGASFQQEGAPLESQWVSASATAYQSPAASRALRGFGVCVRRQGAPTAAAGSPEQFQVWLGNVVNPPSARSNVPPPSGPRAALDSRWSAVWAACAAPVVAVRQRLLLPVQRAFLRAHKRKVAALERAVAISLRELQGMAARHNA